MAVEKRNAAGIGGGWSKPPRWWPAPFWGGPGGTGSCSPPTLRDTPLGTSQRCCFGGPRIAFLRGSIVFSRHPLGTWVLAVEQAERAPCRRRGSPCRVGTRLAHWDELDPGGGGALGAPAPVCVRLWRAGGGPQTRRGTPLPSSPAVPGWVTAPMTGSLPVLCGCFLAG